MKAGERYSELLQRIAEKWDASKGEEDVKGVLAEYQMSLENIRHLKRKYPEKPERTNREDVDFGRLCAIERDLLYVIKWIRTGREPGRYRGVDNRAVYTEELKEPLWFVEGKFQPLYPSARKELSEPVRFQIDEALNRLTPREREVYRMIRGEGFTSAEVGEMLGIEPGTVRKMVQRCERKIEGNKQRSLFLV